MHSVNWMTESKIGYHPLVVGDRAATRPAPLREEFPMTTSSRRAVLRAGVWTVPVVSLATAAPAFAASPIVCTLQRAGVTHPNRDLLNATSTTSDPVPGMPGGPLVLTTSYTRTGANGMVVNTPWGSGDVTLSTSNGWVNVYNARHNHNSTSWPYDSRTQVTLTLSRPVLYLKVEIHNMKTEGNVRDAIDFRTSGGTVQSSYHVRPHTVSGGTQVYATGAGGSTGQSVTWSRESASGVTGLSFAFFNAFTSSLDTAQSLVSHIQVGQIEVGEEVCT